jgi:hypothetical protein
MRFRILLGAIMMASLVTTATGLASTGGVANADPVHVPICGSDEATVGTALSGNYNNLTVTGIAYVAKKTLLSVRGDLTLAPGACLDAFSLGAVHVGNNVTVDKNATLALGCAPGSNGPPGIPPCRYSVADDSVGGSINAYEPQTMYLTAVTVGGSVVSNGGGFHAPGLSFPVKNMKIGGNLVMRGWHGGPGAWIGALRNEVVGDIIVSNNVGHRPGEDGSNDSTEVDGNIVGKDLICQNNTPPAQYGDAYNPGEGNGPNVVNGKALDECASLTVPPPSS